MDLTRVLIQDPWHLGLPETMTGPPLPAGPFLKQALLKALGSHLQVGSLEVGS